MVAALSGRHAASSTARPVERQRRAPLRSRRAAVFPFLDAEQQYSCAISNTGRNARRCPTRQEAPSRRQTPDQARRPCARRRLGWRAKLYLAEMPAPTSPRHTLDEQLQASNARAAEKNLSAKFSSRTIATFRTVRPYRVVGCSNMSASTSTRLTSGAAPNFSPTRVMMLTRSAVRKDLMSPIPGSPNISSRGATFPRFPKCSPRSSAPASGLRHRDPAAALRRNLKACASVSWRGGGSVQLYDERLRGCGILPGRFGNAFRKQT